MKLLALEREVPGVSAAELAPHLEAEAAAAWALHQAGTIRELYFRADRTEAVLVLECASVGDAQEMLSSLPLVRAGLVAFDVIPLRPYPGFSRLFASSGWADVTRGRRT